MDVARIATQAYDWVNLAGKLNDVALDSEALVVGAARSRAALHRRQAQRAYVPRSPLRGAADGLLDVATYAETNARFTFGIALALRRSVPLLWNVPLTPYPQRMYLLADAPFYPFAELVVGRGHSGGRTPLLFPERGYHRYGQVHDAVSRYGVLGFVLERLPLEAGLAAQHRGHHKLAAACLVAAVLGRFALQPFRLAVAGAALVSEAFSTLVVTAVFTAIELTLRLARVSLSQAAAATARPLVGPQDFVARAIDGLENFRNAAIGVLVNDNLAATLVPWDDGSPGVNDRVTRRTSWLIRDNFLPIMQRPRYAENNGAPEQLRELREAADRTADDLRTYCARLPDNTALRGGLRLLVDFIDNDWSCEALDFHPPELEQARAPAA